jgi:anti-sigma B factor antagonist
MTHYTLHNQFFDGVAIIRVSGGCEERCAREMEMLLDKLIAEGHRRYILDVTDLSFAESPGFRLLIRKVADIQELDGNLIVVGLSGRVERAFNLLKLDSLVPTADDVESAIAELNDVPQSNIGTGTYG